MGGPADIPLTTPRLQLSFWASAPQAGLPDYRVRSARPSKGLKDISRKPSERGNLRVQRLRHGQLPSQPRDGGDKARPQAGPTWHCSPSPQALLRAVRREARTMHASRTQEGSGLSSTSPGPAGHPPPPSPRWGPGAAWTRMSLLSLLPSMCYKVLATLCVCRQSAPCMFSLGLSTPSTSLSLLTPAGRPSHRLTLQARRWA